MYQENLREAVKLVKAEGIVSESLTMSIILWKQRSDLYARLMRAMRRLQLESNKWN